jgi:acetyl esterase/lipase
VFWEWEIGNPYTQADRLLAHSPHKHVADISTPMLVIHGERDFRVPIAEGLRLYTDLKRHGVDARFLYFPDENHWILKPQNSRIWYDTVYAFLDHYLLGRTGPSRRCCSTHRALRRDARRAREVGPLPAPGRDPSAGGRPVDSPCLIRAEVRPDRPR